MTRHCEAEQAVIVREEVLQLEPGGNELALDRVPRELPADLGPDVLAVLDGQLGRGAGGRGPKPSWSRFASVSSDGPSPQGSGACPRRRVQGGGLLPVLLGRQPGAAPARVGVGLVP
jgi:hypothetical protein